MAKKYYAVKAGRQVGIYQTWADCQKQVTGYSGAIFKSFSTLEEAEAFIGLTKVQSLGDFLDTPKEARQSYGPHVLVAYIDGSFDKHLGVVGSGGVIFYQGQKEEFSFGTKDPQYTEFWNVAGELLAAMHVINYALKKGAKACALYYDYMGIEMWATQAWKQNNALTQAYAKFAKEAMKSLTIHFHKVAAHTGDTYNERADILAKGGLGKVK